jgi:hypothetical protein
VIDNDRVEIPKNKRPLRHPGKPHVYSKWKWLVDGKVQYRQCLRPRCPYTGVRHSQAEMEKRERSRRDRRARRTNEAPPWVSGATIREKRSVERRLDDVRK